MNRQKGERKRQKKERRRQMELEEVGEGSASQASEPQAVEEKPLAVFGSIYVSPYKEC